MTRSVLVLNGPNLNLLGQRDPEVYGTATLADVEQLCRDQAKELDLEVELYQSNHEGELVDRVHAAFIDGQAVVANLGAYSHTSVAIMDALAVLATPVVEVHISNIHAREEFRRHSYVSLAADAVIVGAGIHGYALALRHVAHLLDTQSR
ncbi:MAG TPA: type II 3-dehydroquinate dehydratase [Nocardioidaceae bacterium]|nr:type II 3-dehydroquinate dehydratase [Nocardioidaceae bacterium]